MKYLLDTNTVSFAIRGIGNVGKKIIECTPSDLCVSTITEAELWFGVNKRKSKKLETLVRNFLSPITKIGFSSHAAEIFGKVHADLDSKEMTIGACDAMIAAVAIENAFILVTDNINHFKRIKNIQLENWKEDQ